MPIYTYRCTKGHQFERFQSMSEKPLKRCPQCRSKVEPVFYPIAVHFKGSGFYNTDYGKNKKSASEKKDSKKKKPGKN